MMLKLIHHSRTVPVASLENEGFDLQETKAFLQRLEERGVPWEVVDAMTIADDELMNLYLEGTLATARRKYRVRQVFGSKRHAGFLFGRGVRSMNPGSRIRSTCTPSGAERAPARYLS